MIVELALNIEEQGNGMFSVVPILSGQAYKLGFIWTYRSPDKAGSWYMNLDDVLLGIKLVNGIDLLGPYHYLSTVPPGKLGIVRNKGTLSKPGFFSLGIEKEMTMRYEE